MPPMFPENFSNLKLNIDTYMTLIWVLFGDRCDLYTQLNQISRMMSSAHVMMLRNSYTTEHCTRLAWAIIDESRFFYNQILTADDFRSGGYQFPTIFLTNMLDDIRLTNMIQRVTYPGNEITPKKIDLGGRNAMGGTKTYQEGQFQARGQWDGRQGRGHGGGRDNQGGHGAGRGYGGGRGGGRGSGRGGYYGPGEWRGDIGDQSLQNEKIATMMRGYLNKFPGHVKILDILGASGKRLTDLPVLEKCKDDTGRPCLCWAYFLGRCTFRECHFKKVGGHPIPRDIPPQFVDDVCAVVRQGVKDLAEGGEPPIKKVRIEEGNGAGTNN